MTRIIIIPDNLIPARVRLVGLDGNAFSMMGAVSSGLRKAGNSPAVIDSYREQSTAGDYDHLLRVAMAFCENDGMGDGD